MKLIILSVILGFVLASASLFFNFEGENLNNCLGDGCNKLHWAIVNSGGWPMQVNFDFGYGENKIWPVISKILIQGPFWVNVLVMSVIVYVVLNLAKLLLKKNEAI
jgi:hypothetical protein